MMGEAKYMEERQSLVFQTERLKVGEEMAKTKARVQILEAAMWQNFRKKERCNWHIRSLLHNTINHQNNPGRSTTVLVDAKSSMVNMDSGASREHSGACGIS